MLPDCAKDERACTYTEYITGMPHGTRKMKCKKQKLVAEPEEVAEEVVESNENTNKKAKKNFVKK